MVDLKPMLKRVPGASSLYHWALLRSAGLALKWRPADDIFREIWKGNGWGGRGSISGPGSDLEQTKVVRKDLPALCDDFGIHSMLDVPCGDFHWMKHVDLGNVDYAGADIVTELIDQNAQYCMSNIHFCTLDLIKDALPTVDLVFCRDCLVHLSYKDTYLALGNICKSGSTYLLTTTFTGRQCNFNIATGQWRPINLQVSPFLFPPPLKLINEECTQRDGAYSDKAIGLWQVSDIRESLTRNSNWPRMHLSVP